MYFPLVIGGCGTGMAAEVHIRSSLSSDGMNFHVFIGTRGIPNQKLKNADFADI